MMKVKDGILISAFSYFIVHETGVVYPARFTLIRTATRAGAKVLEHYVVWG